MKINKIKSTCSIFALSLAFEATSSVAQTMPSAAEMWEIIQKQQEQISRLEQKLGVTEKVAAQNKEKVEETEAKVEATASVIEETMISSANNSTSNTRLGGYAELHYNGGDKDEIDFHRFVLFLGHEFNDSIRFFSELEVEHSIAGEGQPGEIELEQAFIEFDLNQNLTSSVGLQLIPVGILNETHEPPTFYGVERNAVEKNIIPATWWEAGIKFSGKLTDSLQYDAMVHSGLKTPVIGDNAFLIRNGRQKVAEATWKNTAFTGRLSWMPVAGVNLGASIQYQSDLTQSASQTSATLIEAHADIKQQISASGQLGLRALFAQWDLNSMEAELLGRNIQRGWYVEPSYKYSFSGTQAIGIFTRISSFDNNAGNAFETANSQVTFGINYWPHEHVALKADYQIDNNADSTKDDNRINLGVGLQF
ncbi:MAG: porin [Kordiimonadaceae bacterium]|nr:porin [Kordiimonadaceae bacterium]